MSPSGENIQEGVIQGQTSSSPNQSPEQNSPPFNSTPPADRTSLVNTSPRNREDLENTFEDRMEVREPISPENSDVLLRRLRSLSESVSENSQRIDEVHLIGMLISL